MSFPKVSIITCSYNRPDLLRAAVESVRAQTDPDWEHLIFDNGSPNPRVGAVLAWALEDPRVRVWRWKDNLNQPSVLWNFMMDRARGRYLTVLDDDNQKLPTFVKAMSRELDADPTLDVVTCGWRIDRANEPSNISHQNLSTSQKQLDKESTCDGGAMLYRRSTFERAGYFSETLRTNEDWDWLRRAAHEGRVKNLREAHCTYRSHGERRMDHAEELGNTIDVQRVRGRALSNRFGVHVTYPAISKLTQSQRDVCASVENALLNTSWITRGRDLALVVAPFQMTLDEVAGAARGVPRALSFHIEDPYALAANLERVRAMALVAETWVCTNDAAAVPYYRRLVGDRIVVCPTLGVDISALLRQGVAPNAERDIDVLLCGYAYPSRKALVRELLPLLDGLRVLLVGDGWDGFGVTSMPTQGLAETYVLHARARTVVCSHRTSGDCSDGPVKPVTVNRGAMEGSSGARVFLDRARSHHAFDDGDVVWYDGARDLSLKLRDYLATVDADGTSAASRSFAEKCNILYTYRTRLARVIDCVRSPRFMAEIP